MPKKKVPTKSCCAASAAARPAERTRRPTMAAKQPTVSAATIDAIRADQELVCYIKAGYPLLVMVTAEENRAELEIARVAQECGRKISVWSVTEGLVDLNSKSKSGDAPDPVAALKAIKSNGEDGRIYVFRDMHAFYKQPVVVRLMRDIARDFKQKKRTMIVLTPSSDLPMELDRDVVIVNFDLPTRAQLEEIWGNLCESTANGLFQSKKNEIKEVWFDSTKGELTEDECDRIISAALGLTGVESENAFSKAIVQALRWTPAEGGERPSISQLVMREKANAVRKNGILEWFAAKEGKDDIGGLDQLKKWLDVRSRAFSKKARAFGLPMPKGILLVGLPGCGKSLTAKAASKILNVPFIRFDISRVFGGIVGQSEQQMRGALQTIDRVGQCVVWIDEAEKAFAGVGGSGSNDSGVTKRVFGNFLTWMQEKSGASFVVMTVNNIDAIAASSPEMLRKGRFDEIFFVGLPSSAEREMIFSIHIRKNGRDPSKFNLAKLAEEADGFSGAEIEMAVIEGLYYAFYADSELNNKFISAAIKVTNPLSKTQKDALASMKDWAENNAVNASANGKDEGHAGRQLEIV